MTVCCLMVSLHARDRADACRMVRAAGTIPALVGRPGHVVVCTDSGKSLTGTVPAQDMGGKGRLALSLAGGPGSRD